MLRAISKLNLIRLFVYKIWSMMNELVTFIIKKNYRLTYVCVNWFKQFFFFHLILSTDVSYIDRIYIEIKYFYNNVQK